MEINVGRNSITEALEYLPEALLKSLSEHLRGGRMPKILVIPEAVYPAFERVMWKLDSENSGKPILTMSVMVEETPVHLQIIRSQIIPPYDEKNLPTCMIL